AVLDALANGDFAALITHLVAIFANEADGAQFLVLGTPRVDDDHRDAFSRSLLDQWLGRLREEVAHRNGSGLAGDRGLEHLGVDGHDVVEIGGCGPLGLDAEVLGRLIETLLYGAPERIRTRSAQHD